MGRISSQAFGLIVCLLVLVAVGWTQSATTAPSPHREACGFSFHGEPSLYPMPSGAGDSAGSATVGGE